jgi:hypothetical protein
LGEAGGESFVVGVVEFGVADGFFLFQQVDHSPLLVLQVGQVDYGSGGVEMARGVVWQGLAAQERRRNL